MLFSVLLFLSALFFPPANFPLSGQAADPVRYLDSLFQGVEVSTHIYREVAGEELGLEFYQAANDAEPSRPLVLYVHGGGFSGGNRDGEGLRSWAAWLTHRGYTVASISYRLTMKGKSFHCDQPAANKVNTFQAAADDIRAATAWFLARADALRVDPSRIVLAGSSAGAEAILHAGYAGEGPESPELPGDFTFAGLISMAGAMVDTSLIDRDNAVPALLFHGTCDNLVPYGSAFHHYCPEDTPGALMLHGAESIAQRYRTLGGSYQLLTICKGGHEWAGRPMAVERERMVDFLYHDVILHLRRQLHFRQERGEACDFTDQPAVCLD